jgi:transposase
LCVSITLISSNQYSPFLPVCKLLYLPPYSPKFNPIEQAFSSMKAWLRRHFWDSSITRIHDSLQRITPEMARGWFASSGYV